MPPLPPVPTEPTRRLVLEATLDRAAIRGTLTAPTGEEREFHGWLELNIAIERMLGSGGDGTAGPADPGQLS